MDVEELQVIKERAEQVKRLLGHGSYVQKLIENDVPELVAELKDFKAKQDLWQSNIQSLKEEFSARITGVEERLKGIEASRAAMREVLEYVRGRLASLNIGESLSKIDLALSGSTVGNSDSRQAMNDNGAGDDNFQPSNGRSIAG
jgi:septation ring formation regulator EzrA